MTCLDCCGAMTLAMITGLNSSEFRQGWTGRDSFEAQLWRRGVRFHEGPAGNEGGPAVITWRGHYYIILGDLSPDYFLTWDSSGLYGGLDKRLVAGVPSLYLDGGYVDMPGLEIVQGRGLPGSLYGG